MSEKIELDDLLGDSDEEIDVFEPKILKNELNNLLGESDHDDDDEHRYDIADIDEARTKDLDLILGVNASLPVGIELKATSSSMLALPDTFEINKKDCTFFIRTPNFIKIQTEPFVPTTHSTESEKIRFGNTTAVVRWRLKRDEHGEVVYDSAGNLTQESNSKLIKWEDGTFQLVVGDAIFNAKMVAADSCYIFEHQKSINNPIEPDKDVNEETCLKCIGDIQNRLILQPSSIDSETHAKMSLKISDTFKKEQKISIRDYEKIIENPEKTLRDLARREDDQNKRDKKIRLQSEYRMGGGVVTGSSRYSGSGSRRPSMSADYLNDESQFEGDNLLHLKKGAKTSSSRYQDVVDDDEEGPIRHQKRMIKSAYDEDHVLDEDDNEEDEEDEDVEDEESVTRMPSKNDRDKDDKRQERRVVTTKRSLLEKEDIRFDEENNRSGRVDDDEEDVVQQQRNKRTKRTIVDSDEEDNVVFQK